MKYYGLVDIENLGYGFIEEDDARKNDSFIEITNEYHEQLLEEQAQGLQIVSDNKTVFTAEQGLYYVNSQGLWEKKNTEEYEAEKAKQEAERIAMLNLTAADVERGIYKAKGMDFDDILSLVQTYPQEGLDVKALKIELKANHFYRGNPYVNAIGTLLGFTSKQLDRFFEDGNYEHLINNAPNAENGNADSEGVIEDEVTQNDPNMTHNEDNLDMAESEVE